MSAHKHRFVHLFQIVLEVRKVVVIPEARQFFDGIGGRQSLLSYRFFHRLYRSFSL